MCPIVNIILITVNQLHTSYKFVHFHNYVFQEYCDRMSQNESESIESIVVNSQAPSALSPSHLIVQSFANLGNGNNSQSLNARINSFNCSLNTYVKFFEKCNQ